MTSTQTNPLLPPVPPTVRDSEVLAENRGRFQYGYDSDDINRVLGQFHGVEFVCVWDVFDDAGYGGNSEIVGRALVAWDGPPVPRSQRLPNGPWRPIHPDVWEHLSDPESDLDPERFESLLAPEPYENQDLDDMKGDGFCNLAVSATSDYDD